MKKSSRKRGFTLVELVITIVLLSIAMVAFYSFTNNSLAITKKHSDEFYFQSDMRDTMRIIDEKVKKSSAVFAVPQSQFIDNSGNIKMDEEWSYIGVAKSGPNEGQVCEFNFDPVSKTWKEYPLSSGRGGVKYDLEFTKKYEDGVGQRLLSYQLTGIPDDGTPQRDLSTQVEVLNAYTVVNRGTPSDRAVSIAFRSGKREFPNASSITFVIDVSGSMGSQITTKDDKGNDVKKTRIEVVKDAIKQMLVGLVSATKVDVSVVDFADYADILEFGSPYAKDNYMNLNAHYNEVSELLDKVTIDRLYYYKPNGALKRNANTNVGDGLRLAYRGLIKRSNNISASDRRFNYVVLLMDGLPNHYTYSGKLKNFYYGSENITNSTKGSKVDIAGSNRLGLSYSEEVAKYFKSGNTNGIDIPNLKSFIITVGDVGYDSTDNIKAINVAMGNPEDSYYEGYNGTEIQKAVTDIANDLVYNIWSYSGPRVRP